MFYLTIVNKTRRHCHSWLAGVALVEPESYVRGCPTQLSLFLSSFFLIDEGREGLNTTKRQLSSACQQITIEMAFHCRADAGPILKAYLETL